MAHFAEIDNNNIVLRVIVINNDDILDKSGVESEEIGKQFCSDLFGGTWVQTSYNASFRKNYAGIGFKYSEEYDAFIPPKPFNRASWILDTDSCRWVAPVPYPSEPAPDGRARWKWNEDTISWV